MSTSFSQWPQAERATPTDALLDRLVLALDEAAILFCDVAFSASARAEVLRPLFAQRYDEPDLLSTHSMCIYLMLHREHVTTRFRTELLQASLAQPGGEAYKNGAQCHQYNALQSAARELLRSLERSTVRTDTPEHLGTPRLGWVDADDELMRCAFLLDSMEVFSPPQGEIDESTCTLFIACLYRALVAELSIPDESLVLPDFAER